jgi:pyridinium-3,5-bisthiocarboxylic acid mononucleotide nickel chelatase
MKIAYFDCFAGASGDMILGSLLDAGLSLDRLKAQLKKLRLKHYDLSVKPISKRGIGGSQALVNIEQVHHERHHRHLHDIQQIIEGSDLNPAIKERSLAIFTRLAEAEAKVHRTTIDAIHFHEVGAMDAIIDVVGSVSGMMDLGIERVYCSPFHLGCGTVECDHGTMPVPAPATAELIRGKPAYSTGVKGELLTPTGAAILTTIAEGFGPMPHMVVEKIGYGAGVADPPIPNLLRLVIGESSAEATEYHIDRVAVVETNIDDMNPQIYDYLMEKMLAMGALDVFLVPVQMKKNRPATMLTLICRLEQVEEFANFLLTETTTIGLRWRVDDRMKAARSFRKVETEFGPVTFKVAEFDARIVNATPEYEDCKRIALEKGIPLKNVMEQARVAAAKLSLHSSE